MPQRDALEPPADGAHGLAVADLGEDAGVEVTVQPPFAGLTELQGGATLGTSWTRSLPFANLLLVSPR